MNGWQYLIWTALGLFVPAKGEGDDEEDGLPPMRSRQVSITWLTNEIKKKRDLAQDGFLLTKESDEEHKEIYARVYLIGMILVVSVSLGFSFLILIVGMTIMVDLVRMIFI
ncbi:unnamed protein product [Linum trigynum]|uniref:Uncharacterized protein n=1 Tax=Linum trigynum TaxID=586398 RepID=A0AAV2DSP3_9ROSI